MAGVVIGLWRCCSGSSITGGGDSSGDASFPRSGGVVAGLRPPVSDEGVRIARHCGPSWVAAGLKPAGRRNCPICRNLLALLRLRSGRSGRSGAG